MEEFVLHDRDHYRFYLEIDSEEIYLKYSLQPDGVLNIYKAFVPEPLRGRRLGENLMRAAVDYARKMDYKIKPSCSYVSSYFEKNPPDSVLIVR